MARKDVDIKIRATDDGASRNAKKIAEALRLIGTDGDKASAGANRTGAALGALAADLAKLEGRASGLRAFDKMVTDFDKAGAAVQRFETDLDRSMRRFSTMREETRKATDVTRGLTEVVEQRKNAYASQAADLKVATDAQKLNNKELRDAASAQRALNSVRSTRIRPPVATAGVGIEAGQPVSSARASFATFLNAEVTKATAEKARLESTVNGLKTAMGSTKAEIKSLGNELTVATRHERDLANETQRAGNAMLAMRADVARGRAELTATEAAAAAAGRSLGGLATTQDAVARASARSAAQLAQMRGRLEGLGGPAPTIVGRVEGKDGSTNHAEQLRNLQDLTRERARAKEEVNRLGQEMARSNGTSLEYSAALGTAQARLQTLKRALIEQRNAMQAASSTASAGFGAWARAYNPIVGSAERAASAQRNANQAAIEARRQAVQIAPIMQRAGSAMGSAATQTDAFSASLLKMGANSRQSLSLMQRLRGEVLALAASYVGIQAAIAQGQGAVGAFRDMEAAESRLGAVFNQDMRAVSQEIDFLRGQADRLGISFSTLGQQYAKFAVAANAANFSAENTRKIFLSVAEAGRVNKLSVDQLNGTFLAIEQIISKGKFTSEEVRRQLGDRLPGAFNILADAMGVTTMELDKMMQQGELLSTEGNLMRFADELTRRFGPQLSTSLDTFTTDLGRYENAVFKARLALAEGFIPALRQALQAFTNFSGSAEGAQVFASIGQAAGRLIGILAEVPKYFDLMRLAAQAFVAVKLAGFVSDTIGRVMALRSGFGDLSKQMAFIGPQMQRMSFLQRTVGQSFARSVGFIGSYRAALLASAAAHGTVSTRTTILVGALSGLRAVMITVGNAARVMWAAVGGLPGVVITALTFALGKWMTGTNNATSALVEHQRQLNTINEKYQLIVGEVDAWSKAVKEISFIEAEKSLNSLQGAFNKITRSVQDYARLARVAATDFAPDAPEFIQSDQLNLLADALADGRIEVQAFRDAMDHIVQKSDFTDEMKDIARQMLLLTSAGEDGSDSLAQLGQAIAKTEAQLRVHNGTATEADRVTLGLVDAIDAANNSFARNELVDTYSKAIDDLKSKIPSLADELKKLKDITDLNTTAWSGMTAAWAAGDYGKMFEILTLWGQARGEMADSERSSAVGGSLVDRIIGVEKGPRLDSKNPNSTATGNGQFIESTWLAMFKKHFPDVARGMADSAILELRKNADISKQMVEAYANDNAQFLQRLGIKLNDANLYLAHFLGPQGAANLLRADPSAKTSDILGADQISANKKILEGKTAGEVVAWAEMKMGITTQQLAVQGEIAKLDEKAAKDAADAEKATNKRLSDLDHQIAQQRLINSQKEREAAIEDAVRQARAENENISDAQLAKIREQTGLLWDQQNARRELELSEERLNQLYAFRDSLLDQQKMAEEGGDLTRAADLKAQIEGINGQIREAIPGIIEMWEALGGPEADAAIAKLRAGEMSLRNMGKNVIALGLNMDQITQLVGNLADGFVNMLDSMAQSIAKGEENWEMYRNAFLTFAADFLRQIALMILKQITLNALVAWGTAMGGPTGGIIAQAATSLGGRAGHTGGIVGTAAIGSGNRIGEPSWQRSMFTYHTGGRVGLAPDEVSATLRVNEEVLTQQDPRHRDNLGGEGQPGGSSGQGRDRGIKQVLAIGDKEIASAMSGDAGRDTIITHIKRDRSTIRALLGVT